MANTKISALTQLTATTDAADKIAIVDDSATETKYINPDDLLGATTAIAWQVKCGSNGINIADGPLEIDGSSTTGTAADAAADDFTIDGTGARGISILSTTFSSIYAGDAASATVGKIVYDHTNNWWMTTSSGTDSVRLTSAGVQIYDGVAWGDSLNRHVDATSWTPDLQFGGAKVGMTYGTQVGRYYQIGNLVWLYCRIILTAKGSSTGSATIAGVPKTPTADAGVLAPLTIGPTDNLVMRDHMTAYLNPSTTSISLADVLTTAGKIAMDEGDFVDTTELTLAGYFYVD